MKQSCRRATPADRYTVNVSIIECKTFLPEEHALRCSRALACRALCVPRLRAHVSRRHQPSTSSPTYSRSSNTQAQAVEICFVLNLPTGSTCASAFTPPTSSDVAASVAHARQPSYPAMEAFTKVGGSCEYRPGYMLGDGCWVALRPLIGTTCTNQTHHLGASPRGLLFWLIHVCKHLRSIVHPAAPFAAGFGAERAGRLASDFAALAPFFELGALVLLHASAMMK